MRGNPTLNATGGLSAPPNAASSRHSLSQAGEVRLPTFLIIGAARSGTTSLHYTLAQHPQIFMSPSKETNFFAFECSGGEVPICTRIEDMEKFSMESARTFEDYCSLFRAVGQKLAIGESSPSYLITPGVPETIRSFLPSVKLIAILRQPIDKTYSHFLWRCGRGVYSRDMDFAEVLMQDEERITREGRGTSLLANARYYTHLKRFYDVFDSNKIKVCFLEDMEARPEEFYADIFSFIGVDPAFKPDLSTKFNQSGTQKKHSLLRYIQLSRPLKNELRTRLPPALVMQLSRWHHKLRSAGIDRPDWVSPELRRALTKQHYGDEIDKLQDLIGRDLSYWLA